MKNPIKNHHLKMGRYELLSLPENTLGFALGSFLINHDFEQQPENHDAIHVLTGIGISVIEEIGMQYYLLGNGKRNLQQLLLIAAGTLRFPSQLPYFLSQYQKGRQAHYFHYLDFSSMLTIDVATIRQTFKIL